jgi:hypothetical protein
MEMIVNKYNNKIHESLFNKFTSNKAQNNPIIKQTFIMEKQKELRNKNMNNFKQYQLGDYLLCHIHYEIYRLGFKRRRNFDTLATFVRYIHANDEVEIIPSNEREVIPMYYTKKLTNRLNNINPDINKYFNINIIN